MMLKKFFSFFLGLYVVDYEDQEDSEEEGRCLKLPENTKITWVFELTFF